MTANDSPTEESELTPKQEQFIAALVAGNPIVVAAKAVGIGEKTAHRWLKQPAFNQVYGQAKQAIFDEELNELRESKKLIRDMLVKHISAEVPVSNSSQLQAAKLLLDHYVVAGEMAELNEKMDAIQEKLKALGVEL